MLEAEPMDQQPSNRDGLANWLARLDGRVTRLEERSIRHDGDLLRLERAIERLTDTLTQHIHTIEGKIDSGQRWLIGFLATSIITLTIFGAKVVFDSMGGR